MKHFIIAAFIYLLMNVYVFIRGWQVTPSHMIWKVIYIVIFVFLAFSFLFAMGGRSTFPLPLMKILMLVGTTWLLVCFYLVIILGIIDLFRLVNHFFPFFPAFIQEHKMKAGQILATGIFVFFGIILSIGYYKFSNPVVSNLEINIDKYANGRKSLHAVAVSDIHLGFTIGKERLKEYVRKINDLNPEIIFISGDLIDMHTRPLEEQKMYEELLQLKAPLGVYMVPGNHEYISGISASETFIAKTGIRELKNEYVCPDSTFVLVGQDDFSSKNQEKLGEILKGINIQLPLIVLNHQPQNTGVEDAVNNRIDLYLCGHTHQGQVWLVKTLVEKMYKISYGYQLEKNTHIYVSSGLGLWGPPYRLGTQSEIVNITLNFK